MTPTDNDYRAYLLRLWRTPEARWRATLEDPHTGERRAFATLEQLLLFLDQPDSLTNPASTPAQTIGGENFG